MKIILINGQGGTGKTTIANAIKNKLKNSAFIDADALVSVNPFEFEKLTGLMHKNAQSLISNFTEAGYENIVTAGLTRNQEQLDVFIELLPKDFEIFFVWLRADKETRIARKTGRKRDDSDNPEWFEFLEKVYPDAGNFQLPNGKILELDVSKMNIDEVMEEVLKSI